MPAVVQIAMIETTLSSSIDEGALLLEQITFLNFVLVVASLLGAWPGAWSGLTRNASGIIGDSCCCLNRRTKLVPLSAYA